MAPDSRRAGRCEGGPMSAPFGTAGGTEHPTNENVLLPGGDKTFAGNNFESSWGETRTPDPGIMSAVL
jgi:hypothetical protein